MADNFQDLCSIDLTETILAECFNCKTSNHLIRNIYQGGYLCTQCGDSVEIIIENKNKRNTQNKNICSNCDSVDELIDDDGIIVCTLCGMVSSEQTTADDIDYFGREMYNLNNSFMPFHIPYTKVNHANELKAQNNHKQLDKFLFKYPELKKQL